MLFIGAVLDSLLYPLGQDSEQDGMGKYDDWTSHVPYGFWKLDGNGSMESTLVVQIMHQWLWPGWCHLQQPHSKRKWGFEACCDQWSEPWYNRTWTFLMMYSFQFKGGSVQCIPDDVDECNSCPASVLCWGLGRHFWTKASHVRCLHCNSTQWCCQSLLGNLLVNTKRVDHSQSTSTVVGWRVSSLDSELVFFCGGYIGAKTKRFSHDNDHTGIELGITASPLHWSLDIWLWEPKSQKW